MTDQRSSNQTRWMIASGPDGYNGRIVTGQEALERAYLECIFGAPLPSHEYLKESIEEMELQLERLRDPDFWATCDGELMSFERDFEDGWIAIFRLTDESAAVEPSAGHFDVIVAQMRYWLTWNENAYLSDGEEPTDDTHIIMPVWPTRGQVKAWIHALEGASQPPSVDWFQRTVDAECALVDARRYVEAYEPKSFSEAHDRDLMLNTISAITTVTKEPSRGDDIEEQLTARGDELSLRAARYIRQKQRMLGERDAPEQIAGETSEGQS